MQWWKVADKSTLDWVVCIDYHSHSKHFFISEGSACATRKILAINTIVSARWNTAKRKNGSGSAQFNTRWFLVADRWLLFRQERLVQPFAKLPIPQWRYPEMDEFT
jgi:hypothetical protein